MEIHDSMLFRWAGHALECPDEAGWSAPRRTRLSDKPLSPAHRETYLGYLKDAIDPKKGLLVSDYSGYDVVGKGALLGKTAPCLFFTEQSTSDPDEHWRRYGRLGFGFSKRFIFECGGRPVIYTGGRSDLVVQAVNYLRRTLAEKFPGSDHPIHSKLELLAQLIKCTHLPPHPIGSGSDVPGVVTPATPGKPKRTKKKPTSTEMVNSLKFDYPAQKSIRFLREREWRLLWNKRDADRWHVDHAGRKWFRPKMGRELQIVILPNNHLLHSALGCTEIRALLTPENGPPVHLISSQALQKL